MRSHELTRWKNYFEYRNSGLGVLQAARKAKIGDSTAYRFERNDPASQGIEAAARLGVHSVAGELVDQPLNPEAVKALSDFAYFRYRYFGKKSRPWQERAAYDVLAALSTDDREYIVNNEPPGSGKSTLFTCDIPCWLVAKDRSIEIQIGSRTERQARMYVARIKRSLEREVPLRTDADSLVHGIAWDAQAALMDDYGSFQPPGRSDLWRADGLVVAQTDGTSLDDKEPTVSAWGQDSGFLGGRFDLIVWDDLVDKKNTRNLEAREALRDWYFEQAETRLEPKGALILQGQRIGAQDLYKTCRDQRDLDDRPKYRSIIYKAHDELRCKKEHAPTDPAWPDGCLLDPVRLPWRMLAQIQHNNPRVYAVQYQQEDGDISTGLAEMAWFTGGLDSTGYNAPGCLDEKRNWNEVPEHLTNGRGFSMVTVDPSPTEYWGIIWWVIDPETSIAYAVDIIRRRMNPEQFISLDLDTFVYSGLLVDFRNRSIEQSAPITHVVVEFNAAQRWLVQQPHVQKWMSVTGVVVVPHTTHVNKADPKYGLEATGDWYRQGLIRLPWAGGGSRIKSDDLIKEATQYPDFDTDDLVMSTWFMTLAVHNLAHVVTHRKAYEQERPEWLRRAARGLAYTR